MCSATYHGSGSSFLCNPLTPREHPRLRAVVVGAAGAAQAAGAAAVAGAGAARHAVGAAVGADGADRPVFALGVERHAYLGVPPRGYRSALDLGHGHFKVK